MNLQPPFRRVSERLYAASADITFHYTQYTQKINVVQEISTLFHNAGGFPSCKRGKRPDQPVLNLAEQKEISILATPYRMFTACGLLFENGLRGGCDVS